MKDTFDARPITVASHLQSEPKPLKCTFEMVRVIDEERSLLNVLFI